ncbi:MAG TPA: YitT family protein [Candidatus Merdivicinus intestinigallinarum]|nr:YitT family protein [Candidatus Merdivicinus intestinigallinarum]
MKRSRVWDEILDVLVILIGTFIYTAGLYFFIEPQNMAPGGVSGIALIINFLTSLPVGMLSAVLNVPLLLIGFRFVGKDFLWKTLVSVGSFTVFYDYILSGLPVYKGDALLSCLFGGVLWGIGIGLVFMRSGSTGGTDILNKMIHQKWPHFQLGKVTFATDAVIILASIFVFRSLESGLYAIITIFVCTQIMDMVLYSGDRGKLVYVFSDKTPEISAQIMDVLERGTTFLKGEGGYTGEERKVLLCAVRRSEYYQVKRLVYGIDPRAFLIVTDSAEVMGEGFRPPEER